MPSSGISLTLSTSLNPWRHQAMILWSLLGNLKESVAKPRSIYFWCKKKKSTFKITFALSPVDTIRTPLNDNDYLFKVIIMGWRDSRWSDLEGYSIIILLSIMFFFSCKRSVPQLFRMQNYRLWWKYSVVFQTQTLISITLTSQNFAKLKCKAWWGNP